MFIKLNTSTKDLLQIGYSKSEITVSETSETNEKGIVTITYDFGSGNSCIECTDEDVLTRLNQLDDYVKSVPVTGTVYNIKWSNSKVKCEEIKDIDGNSHDPKQYVQSHLKGDDTAKTSRLLADEWKIIRTERDRLLTSTDWWGASDQTMSDAQTAYRVALRTLPADQSSKTTYASITWPTKP
jgi:hypothetical protein